MFQEEEINDQEFLGMLERKPENLKIKSNHVEVYGLVKKEFEEYG